MATSEQGNVQLSRVNYIDGRVFDKTDEESIEITTIGAKYEFLTGFSNLLAQVLITDRL
jgi:hypothetical protein